MSRSIGHEAPALTFRHLDGGTVHTLADFRGQAVVLMFWNTHCSGCKMQMPELSQLQADYADRGLTVIYLSSESKETLHRFFAKHERQGVKGQVKWNNLTEPYQLLATPSTFIIDPDGMVREAFIGPRDYAALEQLVTPHLP